MFIRWKKRGDKKYAYLEQRKRIGGKVVTESVAYLGAEPGAKLKELVSQGKISRHVYDQLQEKLPEDIADSTADQLGRLKTELDMLNEKDIMDEFKDMSSYFAHIDGVRCVLRKIEEIKSRFPGIWPKD